MACREWDSRIDPYLDGEIDAAEAAAVDAHLKTCAACASDALSRRELRLAIREAGAAYFPDPALVRRLARPAAPRRLPGPARLAIAAALLAALGLAALLGARHARRETVTGAVLDLHVAASLPSAALDVVSSDRHTVKPWFEGRVPFTFDLPDLSGSPFTLLGARLTWVGRSPVAHLLFQVRRHRISVFVAADPGPLDSFFAAPGSFHALPFEGPGVRYVAVSDTGSEELLELARLFRSARPG